ncbi:MAG: flagellar export chaperone FliS [Steroidobacteraceae bacterium]
MPAYSNASSIAAYRSVATHGASDAADPYQLICMLMDGALERLHLAKTQIKLNEVTGKAATLHRVNQIIDELRMSLDHSKGGEISGNLDRLYDYMTRRVMFANLKNDVDAIDEVGRLLGEIRSAWGSIPMDARRARS